MALPDTYKQVEYIESSGTQYIDTGYIITVPKYDMDFEFVGGESSSWIPMLGIRDDSVGGNRSYFGLYVHSGSLYVTPNYGGFDPGTSSGLTISKNTKYNIVEDEGQFYIDGVYKSSCSTTNTYMGSSTKTLYIFAMNNRDDIVQYRGSMMKLYYFKLYDNGTLVRDFVPVIRKSDSKPGLYDLVNNVFYTNQGTGEFNYKEYPKSGPIQKIYIGVDQVRPDTWKPGANTIAYYPFSGNGNDYSGNGYNLTKYGNATFGTYQGVSCLYLPGDLSSYLTGSGDSNTYSDFTISIWFYLISNSKTQNLIWFGSPGIFINTSNQPRFAGANGIPTTPTITNAWKNIVCTANGTTAKIYINGVAYSGTWQTQYPLGTNVRINQPIDSSHDSKGYLSNVITESRVWTAQEVSDYFNATKSLYGL